MTMVGNIKIRQLNGIGNLESRYDIEIDGVPVNHVRAVDFHAEPYEVPHIDLELVSGFEFDGLADIGINISPESTVECIRGLDFALRMDESLRDGFLASIRSALDEAGNYENNDKLAERILDRVLGTDVSIQNHRYDS